MIPLIFILISWVLFAGFLGLISYESARGVRLQSALRERLDRSVGRIQFIYTHVNFGVFLRDEIRHLASRIGHDVVHLSLLVVRAMERLLTRLVRRLRTNPEVDQAPRETAREFVKTLSDFKENLKATHPEISAIQE